MMAIRLRFLKREPFVSPTSRLSPFPEKDLDFNWLIPHGTRGGPIGLSDRKPAIPNQPPEPTTSPPSITPALGKHPSVNPIPPPSYQSKTGSLIPPPAQLRLPFIPEIPRPPITSAAYYRRAEKSAAASAYRPMIRAIRVIRGLRWVSGCGLLHHKKSSVTLERWMRPDPLRTWVKFKERNLKFKKSLRG